MSLNPLLQTLDHGGAGFASLWRGYTCQWNSQPQFLKVVEAYCGVRFVHSSQIAGFATRKTTEPGPKFFLGLGVFNVAHARSLGYPDAKIDPVPDLGLPPKLPETLSHLWIGQEPLLDASGVAMGPSGLWEAFTGLRALGVNLNRSIPPERVEEALRDLGRHVRLLLGAKGVDWLSELPSLRERSDVLEDLLMGRPVQPDRLQLQLERIAQVVGTSEDDLWNVLLPS